jgi:hypothetical protein
MTYERINMRRVVKLVHERGMAAMLEHTGGGVRTIFAGPVRHEPGFGDRWAAVAGPGVVEGEARYVGHPVDFYVGPNDSGEAIPLTVSDLAVTSDEDVAALIVAQARQPDSAVPLSVEQVWALGLDGTGRGVRPV